MKRSQMPLIKNPQPQFCSCVSAYHLVSQNVDEVDYIVCCGNNCLACVVAHIVLSLPMSIRFRMGLLESKKVFFCVFNSSKWWISLDLIYIKLLIPVTINEWYNGYKQMMDPSFNTFGANLIYQTIPNSLKTIIYNAIDKAKPFPKIVTCHLSLWCDMLNARIVYEKSWMNISKFN